MLAFAAELYLKALLSALHRPVKRTHNLMELFCGIPEAYRREIVAHYDRASATMPPGQPVEFIIGVGTGTHEQPENPPPEYMSSDNSLEAVLERCKDAFQNWRYFHETGEAGRVIFLSWEFQRLEWICAAIRAQFAHATVTP
jgi:hypothetical protein